MPANDGKQTIRVGIVGAGANTQARHIPGLRAMPGVTIAGVCNRSRESSEAVAGRFGIPRVFEGWEALVASPDIDAVVIGTWPYMHAPVTLAALAAGKHVLCEARMAINLDEARRMLAAARAVPGQVAQLVPAPFTFGVDATVRRLLSEGYCGELLAIELRVAGGEFVDPGAPLTWRRDRRLSGNNIMGMGIWYESLMRWVGEATRVSAFGRVAVRERTNPATGRPEPVTIPEHLLLAADYACGAAAHMVFSQVTGLGAGEEVSLYGREGTLRYSRGVLSGGRRGSAAAEPIPIPPGEACVWRVEEEFVNAIRGLEPVRLTPFETGVRYMAFTEAVARSLADGGHPHEVEP